MLITIPGRAAGAAARCLTQSGSRSLTYDAVGATRTGAAPPGFHHIRRTVALGSGDDVFGRACRALRGWEAHRGAGATVTPRDAPLVEGTEVVVTLPIGPLRVLAPCRIVWVVDEATCFGFGYGTLPGHPERGEEAFRIRRDPDGGVTFEIEAFSKPAGLLATLGAPVARRVQAAVTERYLQGVARTAG
jgi:uncharacterized protein (UPF0548 family)